MIVIGIRYIIKKYLSYLGQICGSTSWISTSFVDLISATTGSIANPIIEEIKIIKPIKLPIFPMMSFNNKFAFFERIQSIKIR